MCWWCSQVLLVVYEFVRQFVVFHEFKGVLHVVDALFLISVVADDVRRRFARFWRFDTFSFCSVSKVFAGFWCLVALFSRVRMSLKGFRNCLTIFVHLLHGWRRSKVLHVFDDAFHMFVPVARLMGLLHRDLVFKRLKGVCTLLMTCLHCFLVFDELCSGFACVWRRVLQFVCLFGDGRRFWTVFYVLVFTFL